MESHRARKQCFWTDNWWDVCASVFIQGAGTQKRAGPRTSWNAKNWLWAIKSLLTDALGNGLRPTQTIFNNGPSGRSETSLDWALKPLLGKKKKKNVRPFQRRFPYAAPRWASPTPTELFYVAVSVLKKSQRIHFIISCYKQLTR